MYWTNSFNNDGKIAKIAKISKITASATLYQNYRAYCVMTIGFTNSTSIYEKKFAICPFVNPSSASNESSFRAYAFEDGHDPLNMINLSYSEDDNYWYLYINNPNNSQNNMGYYIDFDMKTYGNFINIYPYALFNIEPTELELTQITVKKPNVVNYTITALASGCTPNLIARRVNASPNSICVVTGSIKFDEDINKSWQKLLQIEMPTIARNVTLSYIATDSNIYRFYWGFENGIVTLQNISPSIPSGTTVEFQTVFYLSD